MLEQGMIDTAQHDWATRSRNLGLKPGRLYKQIREPYFFGYVRDELIHAYGAETVRSGGLSVYTTILPRWQKMAQQAIRETLTEPSDPAAAVISIDPGTGAIRAMTAVIPGRRNNQFNLLSQARRQPGSTFKTFVLTAAVDKGINPDTSYYVSAPSRTSRSPTATATTARGGVSRRTTRRTGLDVGDARDAALRQRRVRAADARRRAGSRCRDGAKLGVRDPARRQRALRAGDGARHDRRFATRHGVGLRDVAAGGIYSKPTAIRRSCSPTAPRTRGRAGDAAAHARDLRRRAAEVTKILEENVSTAPARAPVSGARRPARRGPPTSTRTHGSSATRRTLDRRLDGLPGVARSRWRTCTGSPSPAAASPPRSGAATWSRRWRRHPSSTSTAVQVAVVEAVPPWPILALSYDPNASSDGRDRHDEAQPEVPARQAPWGTADATSPRACRRANRGDADRGVGRGARLAHTLAARAAQRRAAFGRNGMGVLAVLAAGFVVYLAALALLRSRGTAIAGGGGWSRLPCQLLPLGAPLLLSTDAWTYWDYGRLAAVQGGNPYVDARAPSPTIRRSTAMGARWRDKTSVSGPAFTLASEPLARAAGSSRDSAGWEYKVLAALAALACMGLAAWATRRRALAAALVGWNPVLAIHLAGGGHNDAWIGLLVLGALALAAARRANGSAALLDPCHRGQVATAGVSRPTATGGACTP